MERVQVTIEELEQKVELATKWSTLLDNPLYNELVTMNYLGDDSVRLVLQMKPKAEDNEITSNMLIAKSVLSRYVGHILDEGQTAYESLVENKALQDELDAEVK